MLGGSAQSYIPAAAEFTVVALQLLSQHAAFEHQVDRPLIQSRRGNVRRLLDAHDSLIVDRVTDNITNSHSWQQILGKATGMDNQVVFIQRLERRQIFALIAEF